MGLYIIGFVVAVILAAIILALIAYWLFVRERHKSEAFQYDIGDLKHRNQVLAMEEEIEEETRREKELTAGVIFIPSRHKQVDDYEKRPDYPESPAPITAKADRLIEILNDGDSCVETAYKDGIYEVDSAPAYHSDV